MGEAKGATGSMTGHDNTHVRSRLFTVRVWGEIVDGGIEYRGQVRDAASGAHGSFRRWSELTTFLAEQLREVDQRRDTER
jgi:hypothetical protein